LKQIVVLSGKGGTEKTTFAASFAALSQNIVVADCDVDAADLHLLLKPEKTEFKQEFTGSKLAFINKTLCVECEASRGIKLIWEKVLDFLKD